MGIRVQLSFSAKAVAGVRSGLEDLSLLTSQMMTPPEPPNPLGYLALCLWPSHLSICVSEWWELKMGWVR